MKQMLFGENPICELNTSDNIQQILLLILNIRAFQTKLKSLLFQQVETEEPQQKPLTLKDLLQDPVDSIKDEYSLRLQKLKLLTELRVLETQKQSTYFSSKNLTSHNLSRNNFINSFLDTNHITPNLSSPDDSKHISEDRNSMDNSPEFASMKQEADEDDSEQITCDKVSASKKIAKGGARHVNKCGHPERKHYAKGLCNYCYHKFGRTGKPKYCEHDVVYAKGLCQKCYSSRYHQVSDLSLQLA